MYQLSTNMLTLDEISIAFKKCNGITPSTFKDHLTSLHLTTEQLVEGTIIDNAFNYILSDIDILLDKSILNAYAADHLIKSGFFNWGFVSSYYSNFFSIQALNRLQLNFHVWNDANILCEIKNYITQELSVIKNDKSKNTHEIQFNKFYNNFQRYRGSGIDRYCNIGILQSTDGSETHLRNEINYVISKDYYYELDLDHTLFKKITQDNTKSPFNHRPTVEYPKNYSLNNLKLSMSRLRMLTYILNLLANKNIEYKSYNENRMDKRLINITQKYPKVSPWLKELSDEWLKFEDLKLETEMYSTNKARM